VAGCFDEAQQPRQLVFAADERGTCGGIGHRFCS
jgi:hypothetical protein